MIISGGLALGGLSGVILDKSQLRSIGIVGYAAVFPVAALLLATLFYRAGPAEVPAVPRPAIAEAPLATLAPLGTS